MTLKKLASKGMLLTAAVALASVAFGADSGSGGNPTIGDLADNLTGSFHSIGNLMVGLAYIAGIGFGVGAVFKFKQHKDNPTQIPIGTPFALLAVSVILVFLPSLYAPAGSSIFGENADQGGFQGGGWKDTSKT